ncbi:MAG: T9SS type A sorting domain-containing protein, partial [Balneola sp.]
IYEIHDNWSLKFNYSNMSVTESDNVFFPSVEDRFVLKMIPKELVDTGDELPITVELHQNYPNPFNPTTTISFYMPEEGLAKLSVFNIVGQPVAVLLQENKAQGEHSFEWDASDMPSGIYIYQLEVGTKIMTRKMTLVK